MEPVAALLLIIDEVQTVGLALAWIVEEGSHAELLASQGRYAVLWEMWSG